MSNFGFSTTIKEHIVSLNVSLEDSFFSVLTFTVMSIAAVGNVTVYSVLKSYKNSVHTVKVKVAFITQIRSKRTKNTYFNIVPKFLSPPCDRQVAIKI